MEPVHSKLALKFFFPQFLQAAGNADGQFMYGYCLEKGFGVSQNYEEAAHYYKLSADQGNADGQFMYGYCLEKGFGVSQNYEEAAHYYKLSADQGNADGQFKYGYCLEKGRTLTPLQLAEFTHSFFWGHRKIPSEVTDPVKLPKIHESWVNGS